MLSQSIRRTGLVAGSGNPGIFDESLSGQVQILKKKAPRLVALNSRPKPSDSARGTGTYTPFPPA